MICALPLDVAGWLLIACFLVGGVWTVGVPLRARWHEARALRAARARSGDLDIAARASLDEADGRIKAGLLDGPLSKPPTWVVVVSAVALLLRIAVEIAKTSCAG
ncbi:hypothetical protein [uncultured Salipiger sp.]|uniref:hypothetical protein n=1 Tax=uncultured Salipiger sp. TaxID=499810 RepID=UPI002596D64B|nr:hypothetical protein [uncultured Salipiger sp.]